MNEGWNKAVSQELSVNQLLIKEYKQPLLYSDSSQDIIDASKTETISRISTYYCQERDKGFKNEIVK